MQSEGCGRVNYRGTARLSLQAGGWGEGGLGSASVPAVFNHPSRRWLARLSFHLYLPAGPARESNPIWTPSSQILPRLPL